MTDTARDSNPCRPQWTLLGTCPGLVEIGGAYSATAS